MQKYNILELNENLLPELQSIAEELGIKKVSSLKKEELVYRILDEQAISYAGIQAEKEKEKEAKKAERQTKAKKTKAAAPKGAKADAKTKVAAPATPVEASVEEVAPEAPEQPERKRRTRIDKKEKVAAAVVPVQKNEEAAVSKSPVSANHLHSLNPIHPHIQLSGIPAMHLPFPLLPVRHLSILLCFHSPENPNIFLHPPVTSYRQMIHILSHFPLTAFLRMSLLRLSHLNT